MQTYSHFLMTAWLRSKACKQGLRTHWAMVLGSVAPDLPLVALTLNFFYQRGGFSGENVRLFGPQYDELYFNDPLWVASHNMLHSPPPLILFVGIGYWFGVRGGSKLGFATFWFALACALHSIVDIATHHDDGPLLAFPFDWQCRFASPISY